MYDFDLVRITIFAPDGTLVRLLSLGPLTSRTPDILGRLANGLYVGRRLDYGSTAEPGSRYRTKAALLLLDGEGHAVDSVVGLPDQDMIAPAMPNGPYISPRLARGAVFAVHPDGVSYGGQDDAGLIRFDVELEPERATQTVTRSEVVTEDVREAFQAMIDEGADRPPDGVWHASRAEYVDSMPAFGQIIGGEGGRVWVEDPIRPGRYPLTWTAYEDGRPVARVEIAPRFSPLAFGRDWVLGVSYDELTIERIELWRFVPGQLHQRALVPRDAAPPGLPQCGAWASR